ncbi:ABC transporter permease [Pyramidobacter piscolens]|uniref:ABC transporter permease n=1 Tax=Pyramidobacter piscolens TaxID=638849 RepID=UPI0026DFDC1C|nr:ABC transporter permease [Pyramidobacter piscolens]
MTFMKRHLQQFALAGVILLFGALFCATSPYFWDADNLRNILDQSTVNVVAGLGMTLVLTSGVTDLSVGSAAALTGVLTALAMKAGAPAWAGCALALLCGLGVGLWNSLIIVRVGVNPFMGTLTSMSVFSGLALVITQASPVYGLPPAFTWIGRGRIGGMPASVLIAAALFALIFVLYYGTRCGVYVSTLGVNAEALCRCGVNDRRWRTGTFCACSLCAAVASILITARLNCAEPLAGAAMNLDAIATSVLGGTAPRGGRAALFGTALAGVLLALVKNGLTMWSVSSYYQELAVGVIILVSIVLSETRRSL